MYGIKYLVIKKYKYLSLFLHKMICTDISYRDPMDFQETRYQLHTAKVYYWSLFSLRIIHPPLNRQMLRYNF